MEKPTPELNYVLTYAPSLSMSLSRNEASGTVLQVAATACQNLTTSAPAGVTVTFYRMPQVTTTTASFKGGIVGKHYDPLVPVALTGGQVCPSDGLVWMDTYAATTVTPGTYEYLVGDLPVNLTVWKMQIPSWLTLPVYIQLESYALLAAHGLSSSSNISVQYPLTQLYVNTLRADRIEPIEQRVADPAVSGSTMAITAADWSQLVLTGAEAPVCAIAPSAITSSWDTAAQLAAWEATIKATPALANSWAYVTDEPTDLVGLATRAQLVRTNAPDMKTMVTHVPTTALVGLIDHFTVVFEQFMQAGLWSTYNLTPGYWLYGSCESHGNCGNGNPGTLTGSPDLMLDEPDVNDRAFPLVAYALGGGAVLYYDANYSLSTAWTNQYFFGGNGDGNLMYPGVSGTMGFTSNQPVESIRLKGIRQGEYDVEYLALAKASGLTVTSPVTNQFTWSKKNADYDAMRLSLGAQLNAL
jgi:hypothetical protein